MKSISKGLRGARGLMAVLLMAAIPAFSQRAPHSGVAGVQRDIFVSIPDCKLVVVENGQVIRTFPIAVGTAISPSPTGDFYIVNRVSNPTYYRPGVVISAGRDNPIGTRWLGLDRKGYGIHGTNEPHSIGKAASHGCIRMRNRDIEQFFTLVRVGDAVHIRGERDQQIAALFGGAVSNPVVAETEAAAGQAGGGQ